MSASDHHRRISVPLGRPDPSDPLREETFELVLFYKDEKLRSHAVKHLTNLRESETTWKILSPDERGIVTGAILKLQELGCPYFSAAASVPPCEYGVSSCRLYPACSRITGDLEAVYLRALTGFVMESVKVPRYARFFSDRDGNTALAFMPNRPVVVKASLMEENIYNILTCYGAVGMSFAEMRDQQVEMIRNEARGRTITLCDERTWGVEAQSEDEPREGGTGERDAAAKSAKRKSKAGRFRGGGAHWRRFLDESE